MEPFVSPLFWLLLGRNLANKFPKMIALFIALGSTVSWRASGIDRRTSMDNSSNSSSIVLMVMDSLELNNVGRFFRATKVNFSICQSRRCAWKFSGIIIYVQLYNFYFRTKYLNIIATALNLLQFKLYWLLINSVSL